ncbi:MAG TPA: GcrA family cell cycle regulator [Alphaproteobacteria bacterium]|nr:GcrA family cell cycle regulator [Alphaproteobacteria bacterium]
MAWTDQRVEMLKKFWLQGFSASQIAKKLGGVTRNAVIGKAHRMGLTGRLSPIKRQESKTSVEVFQTDLRPLTDTQAAKKPCMWPVGDPKQSDFHFCGHDSEVGRPYCTEHCVIAYNRKHETAA